MDKLIAEVKKLGLRLSQKQVDQFQTYYQEMVEWNKRMNLTSITDYEEVQIKHFLDALTITLAFHTEKLNEGLCLIDVGSGAGIPGIPLKIMFTDIRLVLLDSVAKKAAFLCHLKQKLGLDDVEVVVGRAEEVAHHKEYREKFDVVVSRAVAELPTLVELTLPFCTIGGSFIAQKKGEIEAEISQATKAINILGGRLRETNRIDLEAFPDERYLVIIDKVSATPQQYPRHTGIPAKRPIL